MPVWQAIRPMSRALSVHQGKGFDACSARIGALMEALESAHAEAWSAAGPVCAWRALPPAHRSVAVDDFARERGLLDPDAAVGWVEADPLGDTPPFFVPEMIVSQDFTRDGGGDFARSSNGLAAHFSIAAATRHALHELIERDARGAWQRGRRAGSVGSRVATGTIRYGWFRDLGARLDALDIILRVNRVPAVVPLFVFVVELLDGAEPEHAAAGGAGAHEEVEAALRGAVLEALQSRLTMIAGARDDLPFATAAPRHRALGLGFPTPGFLAEQPLPDDVAAPLDDQAAIDRLVRCLAIAGYPQIGRLTLSPAGSDAVTVKVIVPGLGDLERARRAPCACTS